MGRKATSAGEDFIQSLRDLFEETAEKVFTRKEEFVIVKGEVLVLLLRSGATTAAKARASCPVNLPDGSEPDTFIQLPPSTLRIAKPLQQQLHETRSGDRFIKLLEETIEEQRFSSAKMRTNNSHRKRRYQAKGKAESTDTPLSKTKEEHVDELPVKRVCVAGVGGRQSESGTCLQGLVSPPATQVHSQKETDEMKPLSEILTANASCSSPAEAPQSVASTPMRVEQGLELQMPCPVLKQNTENQYPSEQTGEMPLTQKAEFLSVATEAANHKQDQVSPNPKHEQTCEPTPPSDAAANSSGNSTVATKQSQMQSPLDMENERARKSISPSLFVEDTIVVCERPACYGLKSVGVLLGEEVLCPLQRKTRPEFRDLSLEQKRWDDEVLEITPVSSETHKPDLPELPHDSIMLDEEVSSPRLCSTQPEPQDLSLSLEQKQWIEEVLETKSVSSETSKPGLHLDSEPRAPLVPQIAGNRTNQLCAILEHLKKDLSMIPVSAWETYKKKLLKFTASEQIVTLDFEQRLGKVMNILYLPEELESVATGEWDRLYAVARVCAVITEAIGAEYEVAPEMADKWLGSKTRDITWLKKTLGAKERFLSIGVEVKEGGDTEQESENAMDET